MFSFNKEKYRSDVLKGIEGLIRDVTKEKGKHRRILIKGGAYSKRWFDESRLKDISKETSGHEVSMVLDTKMSDNDYRLYGMDRLQPDAARVSDILSLAPFESNKPTFILVKADGFENIRVDAAALRKYDLAPKVVEEVYKKPYIRFNLTDERGFIVPVYVGIGDTAAGGSEKTVTSHGVTTVRVIVSDKEKELFKHEHGILEEK